jgi:hypothetical protein
MMSWWLVAADGVAECGELGGGDGDDLVVVEADHEVFGGSVGELVDGLFLCEGDAVDDAGVFEEFDGAVDGGLAHAAAFALEVVHEAIGFEEAFVAEDRVEDAGSLGGVLQAFGLECPSEDRAEGLDDVDRVGVAGVGRIAGGRHAVSYGLHRHESHRFRSSARTPPLRTARVHRGGFRCGCGCGDGGAVGDGGSA